MAMPDSEKINQAAIADDSALIENSPAADTHPEEILARLQAQTRRHFLRSLDRKSVV